MPRRSLNVDGRIGGRKSKVRKRGCLSSSSSSSFGHNYRLKRALLVRKKGGSTTPVPMWKMMSSESSSPESDEVFKYDLAGRDGEKVKELSVSARKLAAILWEINGIPSPRLRTNNLEDKTSEAGSIANAKKRIVVSGRTDLRTQGNQARRPQPSSQEQLQSDCNLIGTSLHNSLAQVCRTKNHVLAHCTHIIGLKNRLKDVYDGLATSKELLKVLLSQIWRIEQMNPTSLSLVSALEFELHRACTRVHKLIQGKAVKGCEINLILKKLKGEKLVPRVKEQDHIASIAGELEMQKKLRQKTEKLNEKLEKELLQTKASLVRANKALESEKKAREMVEHVCDELARGIGEDRAEAEELKRQSDKLREEVEKEREMLQLADMIREERVQMKLSEAKYQFEEKSALVDELRNELETYLKSRTCKEQGNENRSPGYDKIKALEKYLKQENGNEDVETTKKVDDSDDSDDSDLCSIELNADDLRKSFIWGDGKSKERKYMDTHKQERMDVFGDNRLLGFTSCTSKRDIEDEMKRYRMIKDLRDHIVSGSITTSSQELSSPSRNLVQPGISPKDPGAVAC